MAFKKFRKMKVYNVSGYNYKDTPTIILNQTTDQIKKMVDEGTMTMVTAVELSYLSEEEQKQVCTVLD